MSGGPYAFPESEGQISVDYRNNDGTIILGNGDWLFATKWSTAGDGSIHAYRDGAPRVAVAPGVNRIDQVTANVFGQANFTSRVRTPRVGEVVLWFNERDYAAAMQIESVTAAPESSTNALLIAKYRILIDKTRDFSTPGDPLVAEFQRAARETLSTFDALSDIPDPPQAEIGIGHNNPPPEARLVKDDFAAIAVELREAAADATNETRLRTIIDLLQSNVDRIGVAVESRLRIVREGFYRQLGAMAAIVSTGLILWLAFYGNLQSLAVAAQALAAHLFGFR